MSEQSDALSSSFSLINLTNQLKNMPFKDRLDLVDASYMLNAAIQIGYKLRLFKVLAQCSDEHSPATVEDVALYAKCKPRYVMEWLAIMAAGDIIEVDAEDRFWIKEENIEVLMTRTQEVAPSSLLLDNDVFSKVIECMKKSGPNGLRPEAYKWKQHLLRDPCDHWNYVEEVQSMCAKALDEELFVRSLSIQGQVFQTRLKSGKQSVLEIGCSSGAHLAVFATIMPDNNYVGVDIDSSAIDVAKLRRPEKDEYFENLQFMEMDGTRLPKSWTGAYDIVFIHFACHDMSRPDKCLMECYRILNETGVLIMIESACASTVFENKKLYGSAALVQYSFSLFQCLPLASNDDDSAALGAMCPKEKLLELIYAAGFTRVDLQHLDKMPSATQLYLGYKN